mgnify:CR=1 FL=1
MERKKNLKPLAAIVGTTFAVSLGGVSIANASEDPFALDDDGMLRAIPLPSLSSECLKSVLHSLV